MIGMLGLQASDPQGGWAAGEPLVDLIGRWGPWVLLALAAVVVVRSVLRRRRYRAVSALSSSDLDAVHAAIREAEERTVGEIVPVVLERSDPHPGAAWVAALCAAVIGSTLLLGVLPWDVPPLLIACQLGLGAVGFLAARLLPDVQRLFITEARATAVAEEQAFQEFFRLGLQRTEAATGVLVFVSLLEHHVVVLGDEGIDAAMGEEHWADATRQLLEGVARGDLAGGLVAAIGECGSVLAEHFPWAEGDRNELPDRLELRRE